MKNLFSSKVHTDVTSFVNSVKGVWYLCHWKNFTEVFSMELVSFGHNYKTIKNSCVLLWLGNGFGFDDSFIQFSCVLLKVL